MHKKLFLLFFSIMILGTIAHVASAVSLDDAISSMSSIVYKPFGGRVLMTSMPLTTCLGGIGPITIQPVGQSKSGSYLARHGSNKTSGQAQTNQWILGNAQSNSQPECTQGVKPYEKPYSVIPITLYGASGFK
jgi:hypothetical protein